jgi:hypothetical protein
MKDFEILLKKYKIKDDIKEFLIQILKNSDAFYPITNVKTLERQTVKENLIDLKKLILNANNNENN